MFANLIILKKSVLSLFPRILLTVSNIALPIPKTPTSLMRSLHGQLITAFTIFIPHQFL